MNTHVATDIIEKWPTYEFIGKPFKLKDGKTYMRAIHLVLNNTHFYCFEDDWFWHDRPVIAKDKEV